MLKNYIKKFIPWLDQDKKILKLYRISNMLMRIGLKQTAKFYAYRISKKYNCYISPKAQIGSNLMLPHPTGIVIGEGVIIGDNCVIYQNVTIGRKNRDIPEYPNIGNNVIVYCNSTVIGNICIGDNTKIGCNSVVMKSISKNSTCVGVVK